MKRGHCTYCKRQDVALVAICSDHVDPSAMCSSCANRARPMAISELMLSPQLTREQRRALWNTCQLAVPYPVILDPLVDYASAWLLNEHDSCVTRRHAFLLGVGDLLMLERDNYTFDHLSQTRPEHWLPVRVWCRDARHLVFDGGHRCALAYVSNATHINAWVQDDAHLRS
jgi:hypothetical protein